MAALNVNGKTHEVNADPNTPLLWVLREQLGMTGTKYGCGIAQCGACTVHVDGVAMRSCSVPLSLAAGKQITTIEGLAQNGVLHKVQKAWVDHDVPQCGYCQSGMIMAVVDLLKNKPKPTDADINRGDHQHLPVRHLPAGARSDSRRGERVREGPHMNYVPKMNRRSFIVTAAAAGGGLALGLELPFGAADRGRAGRSDARARRLGGDQARRHRRRPRRALGDGPRHAHRPLPARRRRARLQLGQGHLGISDPGPERRPQARMGRLRHRRQPRHPHVARVCASGRRGCARDAQAGGGQRVEGAGRGADRRQGRHHAQGVEPHHDLRQGRGRGIQARRARSEVDEAEGPEGLEDRRQAAQAARHHRPRHRQAGLRRRT